MLSESCAPYSKHKFGSPEEFLKETVRLTQGTIIWHERSTSHILVSPPEIHPAALFFWNPITHLLCTRTRRNSSLLCACQIQWWECNMLHWCLLSLLCPIIPISSALTPFPHIPISEEQTQGLSRDPSWSCDISVLCMDIFSLMTGAWLVLSETTSVGFEERNIAFCTRSTPTLRSLFYYNWEMEMATFCNRTASALSSLKKHKLVDVFNCR